MGFSPHESDFGENDIKIQDIMFIIRQVSDAFPSRGCLSYCVVAYPVI
jgi:hypothetical protein